MEWGSTGTCGGTHEELTFETLEGLKEIDEPTCGQLFMVLGGNLHTHL